MTNSVSEARTPYAVRCYRCHPDGGLIYLAYQEYMRQMAAADRLWECPICRGQADWDDDNYDTFYEAQ